MTAEQLAVTLSTLAQFKAPYLAVTIQRDGDWFNGRVIAQHQGRVLAQFGNRLARTLPELKQRLCDYLTFEFRILPCKRCLIEEEIERLNEKAMKRGKKL